MRTAALAVAWVLVVAADPIIYTAESEEEANKFTLPKDFLFGAGTSSYQVEGAWNESGKGMSVFDKHYNFDVENPDPSHNGNVAADSYHHVDDDIEMIRRLKMNADQGNGLGGQSSGVPEGGAGMQAGTSAGTPPASQTPQPNHVMMAAQSSPSAFMPTMPGNFAQPSSFVPQGQYMPIMHTAQQGMAYPNAALQFPYGWPFYGPPVCGPPTPTSASANAAAVTPSAAAPAPARKRGRPVGSKNKSSSRPDLKQLLDEALRKHGPMLRRQSTATIRYPSKVPTNDRTVAFDEEDDCVDCSIYSGRYILQPCGHYPFCSECVNNLICDVESEGKPLTCPHCSCDVVAVKKFFKL